MALVSFSDCFREREKQSGHSQQHPVTSRNAMTSLISMTAIVAAALM